MKESSEEIVVPKKSRLWGSLRDFFWSEKADKSEVIPDAEKEVVVTTKLDELEVTEDSIETAETPEGSEEEKLMSFTEVKAELLGAETVEPLKTNASHERFKDQYLARLAGFDFSEVGNPYLKATLVRRFEVWENTSGPKQLSTLAEYMGMSEEVVEKLLQQRIELLMEQAQFFNATTPDVFINHILGGERRYKARLELYTPESYFIPSYRDNAEYLLFGFPRYSTREGEEAKTRRPIYGYLSLDENGILNETSAHPPENEVCMYGDVTVRIKKETAIKRATMCLLDSYGILDTPISPVGMPHFSSFFFYWGDGQQRAEKIRHFLDSPLDNRSLWQVSGAYTEVQFHGGLNVDDIESVHLSLGNGLAQEEINRVIVAVEAYNRETGRNIPVIIY